MTNRSAVFDATVSATKLSAPVSLAEIAVGDLRLEASAYKVESRSIVDWLKKSRYKLVPLYGETGPCAYATNGYRFHRIYVDQRRGVPFISSSDIIEISQTPTKFLARSIPRLNELTIREFDVLLSRSGTVGNVNLASPRLAGAAASEDAIRIRAKTPAVAGFVSAFLRSTFGRTQISGARYGSVVSHIELAHLRGVVIPDPAEIDSEGLIGGMMLHATIARDEASELLEAAERDLLGAFDLPPLSESNRVDSEVSSVRLSQIGDRLDASHHAATVRAVEESVCGRSSDHVLLGAEDVATVHPITKFRKRVYVRSGGIPMLSSRQIFQIDPIDIKRLARGAHEKDLPEIELAEGMILVTRSGTIGRTQIVPEYMEGWVASEDATRLITKNMLSPEYVFAWLNSAYGNLLLRRYSYGSVVVHIDADMLARVPIPVASSSIRRRVAEKVQAACALRTEAWHNERQAISRLERALAADAL